MTDKRPTQVSLVWHLTHVDKIRNGGVRPMVREEGSTYTSQLEEFKKTFFGKIWVIFQVWQPVLPIDQDDLLLIRIDVLEDLGVTLRALR